MDEDPDRMLLAHCWPLRFYVDFCDVTPSYYIQRLDVPDADDLMAVTRQLWLDMLEAARTSALSQIADALDDTFSVRGGELPSIASSLAVVAAHACPHSDSEDASPAKHGSQEPS